MATIAIQFDQIYNFTQLSPYYIITRFGRMSNHVTYYNLGMHPVEQVEALMMCSIVDDLMTKLNNLT